MERSLLVLVVGCGGFIGAALRYLISLWATKGIGAGFPFGTLIVNILGAILIGFFMETSSRTNFISPTARTFLTTGMMGGLTTFSTFSFETMTIFSHGSIGLGSLNIGLNLVLSLVGVVIGQFIAKILF
ncbi:fluoride efflux transporter CrcB [uncultured Clostridium sp.]|uniref:fluoride efflux transporter CrcB n=1 Tax=uncultured Clostridium sp. TaxID=59620 RepID=UPI00262F332B|nr:fluoride efflux transporter CrcB [uncultured Clostridium sp.]